MTPCPLPDLLIELQLQLQPNHQILQLQVNLELRKLLLNQLHQFQPYLQLKECLTGDRGTRELEDCNTQSLGDLGIGGLGY